MSWTFKQINKRWRLKLSFLLTDDERSFLRHWSYEATNPFFGPAHIWCHNHRISSAYGPYPLAELYWAREIEAGREGWIFKRPTIPFRVPCQNAEQFWLRANTALALIPRLQGDSRFTPAYGFWKVEGILTPEESNYLRAYNQEMVLFGTGHQIDLAHQNGVLDQHLIPFFIVLKDLYRSPTTPVVYPWTDFPARYEQLSGRKYEPPKRALVIGDL
jgi:hypothetical protein